MSSTQIEKDLQDISGEATRETLRQVIEDEPPNKRKKVSSSELDAECVKIVSSDVNDDAILKEGDVGITEFISKTAGIGGVIKQRYSDFIVNEIRPDGSKVQFTSIDIPTAALSEADVKLAVPERLNIDALAKEVVEELEELLKGERSDVTFQASDDKSERRSVHEALKKHFPMVSATTVDKDGTKLIKIQIGCSDGREQKRKTRKFVQGDYCHCVLYKENRDTLQAVNMLAKFLRVNANSITYAGTKDKRAKTSQEICFFRIDAERLRNLNNASQILKLGNFRYEKTAMQLGQSKGNHFKIVLRGVTGDDNSISDAITSLRDVGFLNYFGMQRFGNTCVATHAVGRALLLSHWKEAVDLILKPRGGDSEQVATARTIWMNTGDAGQALLPLGKHSCLERHLLLGLSKCGLNNLVAALAHIPRMQRLMYMHAYQSYVWNQVISHRYQNYGLQILPGDMVLRDDQRDEEPTSVSADNAAEFSIYDVVIPLPGFNIKLPDNSLKDLYTELLQKDGITLDHFKHSNRDYALAGCYRHMIQRPTEVSYSTVRYDDPTVALILSDYEVFQGSHLDPPPAGGKMKALLLDFSLPVSCYATMALRELVKTDTSSGHQTTLNIS